MAKLKLKLKRGGEQVFVTSKGTELLTGSPRLVATAFGTYFVFSKDNKNAENLVRVEGRHRVYEEYQAEGVTVFRQLKETPNGLLKKGEWHVDATTVTL
jgi:hypothetical protein